MNTHNKITLERFKEKAKAKHGNAYDYSKVHDFKYAEEYVTIICKQHGEFTTRIHTHLHKEHGTCPECRKQQSEFVRANEEKRNQREQERKQKQRSIFTIQDRIRRELKFIFKSSTKYPGQCDYSKVHYVNALKKVSIVCNAHGLFKQTPRYHLAIGCPKCRRLIRPIKQSQQSSSVVAPLKLKLNQGQKTIQKVLTTFDLKFDIYKTYYDCVNDNLTPIPFDFYIHSKNMCIIYDDDNDETYIEIQKLYCKSNGIKLLIIPNTEEDNIGIIINNYI